MSCEGRAIDEGKAQLPHHAQELDRLRAEVADQRALLDRLPIATAVKNREGRFLYVNAAAAAGYGLSVDAMVGHREHDLLPRGNDVEEVLTLDREVIDSGRSLSVPGQRFVTSEGRPMVLHMTREPVRFHGEACVLVNAHDVTDRSADAAERRKLERRVAESQRLEGLGLMAGGIAHDFNNLLVGVLTNVDMALCYVDDAGVAGEFLERVKLAAERLTGLSRQMLAYSGRDHIRVHAVELSRLTRETLALIASNIPSHIQIQCELPSSLPQVEGDSAQLSQVVLNLVLNAAEAIGDRSGTIWVRIGKELLDNDRTASLAVRSVRGTMECLCLEVSDDGPGMDSETRNRIFDPFFTTKQQPGRGLGLASVIGIVRTHQGALRVDTSPGAGTRMRVWLPLAAERQRRSSAPAHSVKSELRERHVLIVDDEPLVRETTGSVLKASGLHVYFADSGPSAILAAPSLPQVELVLLDMNMPGMSAQKTFDGLRAALPRAAIMLTSGYNDPTVLASLLAQPATSFIQKPYSVDTLLTCCASLLEASPTAAATER